MSPNLKHTFEVSYSQTTSNNHSRCRQLRIHKANERLFALFHKNWAKKSTTTNSEIKAEFKMVKLVSTDGIKIFYYSESHFLKLPCNTKKKHSLSYMQKKNINRQFLSQL